MTDQIDPSTCPPDQPYMGTVWGKRQAVQRLDPRDTVRPWMALGEWARDSDVSDLVPLVEARPITRDDLPSEDEAVNTLVSTPGHFGGGVDAVLDLVVERLNARGGVPAAPDTEPEPEDANPIVFAIHESDLPEVEAPAELIDQAAEIKVLRERQDWLYSLDPSEFSGDGKKWNVFPFVRLTTGNAIIVGPSSEQQYALGAQEAVDLARALLAAAKRVRL